MSLNYLLDGYNIIKRIPTLAQKKLEDGRETLITMIEVHRPQGSVQNSVTVVFDGRPGMFEPLHSSSVKVIFTENESADDKIKRMVENSSTKKSTVVVTDDKEIKFRVRFLGARVLGVEEFFERMRSKSALGASGKSGKSSKEDAKVISKTLEYEITTEFEKIWLKEDEKRRRPGPLA